MQRAKRHPSRHQERDNNNGKSALRPDANPEAIEFEFRLRIRVFHRSPVPLNPRTARGTGRSDFTHLALPQQQKWTFAAADLTLCSLV
jgi:hypothetical protein